MRVNDIRSETSNVGVYKPTTGTCDEGERTARRPGQSMDEYVRRVRTFQRRYRRLDTLAVDRHDFYAQVG
jgi:hypothetical protein